MENHQQRFMLSFLSYCTQRDLDVQEICISSNINFKSIMEDKAISFTQKQWNDVWTNAVQLSNDQLFGLHFGESMQLAALGVVGEIIKTSSTIGDALTMAAGLVHLISDMFSMEVIKDDQQFSVLFHPNNKIHKTELTCCQTVDFFIAFTIHELDGLLLNKIKPQKLKLNHEFVNVREYERVLRCKPERDPSYCIQFDLKYWNEPIITANYMLQKKLLQYVDELSIKPAQKFDSIVYNYLVNKSYLGIASINDIAGNFNISVRTLQRKLGDEGTTFQQLADQARKQLALKYIKSGTYQIKEISYMLGYNELSAFTRAFKRWTGIPPTKQNQILL